MTEDDRKFLTTFLAEVPCPGGANRKPTEISPWPPLNIGEYVRLLDILWHAAGGDALTFYEQTILRMTADKMPCGNSDFPWCNADMGKFSLDRYERFRDLLVHLRSAPSRNGPRPASVTLTDKERNLVCVLLKSMPCERSETNPFRGLTDAEYAEFGELLMRLHGPMCGDA